jgi:hypothetical protein
MFFENKKLKEENKTLKAQVISYKGFYDGIKNKLFILCCFN